MVSSNILLLHTQDLLDQRIIEYGNFKPCFTLGSVKNAIQDMTNMVNLTLNKRLKIKYTCRENINLVMFDKRRLQQVLLNLLMNAVKYQEQGHITVYSSVFQRNGEAIITVEVKDRGIGFDMAEVEDIFEPFTRAKSRRQNNQNHEFSNGLGLFICKRICQ